MQNSFKVGIYTRLSRDDNNGNLESMSIANQRQILTQYVEERKWKLVEEYTDDSGTNFERPAFRQMVEDTKTGKINCIVTKDLSRLGRNYSMTGYYTDEFFPLNDVRFIAINDGVDTMGDNNDFAAFHNVINEFYPREISKKVRQVKRNHAEKGMFIGSYAPYGYMKAPDNIYQLVVDLETAPIIRRIYEELAMGENAWRIAIRLNEEGVLSPRAYQYYKKGRTNPKKSDKNVWGSTSICNMVKNQVYIGNMVQGQRQVISFKSKKRRLTDPETWVIVENTHEPIVSRELFDQVQKRHTKMRYYTPKIDREISVFAGLVRCMDCGMAMCASLRGGGKIRKMTYRCSKYTNSGKEACASHTIREEVLEKIILDDLSKYAKLLEKDK